MAQIDDRIIAGIDEAGRGPLAGPVVAAAVILDPAQPISGIDDSKKLTERKRDALYEEIITKAKAVGIGMAGRKEIDDKNILQATIVAMQRAVDGLTIIPDHLQIDGQHIRLNHPSQETIVGGDALVQAIGAASIVAKVTRDRMMQEYDKVYPEYGFAKHKGYGTQAHMDAVTFLQRAQGNLSKLSGLEFSGERVTAIKCYLTGEDMGSGQFNIRRLTIKDKHGLSRVAFNAKVNIYRETAPPILLGIQDKKLPSIGLT